MEDIKSISDRDLAFGILKCIKQSGSMNKGNLLRKIPGIPCHLEQFLQTEFNDNTSQRANLVLIKLERDGLIAPTFGDASSPLDWMKVTEQGKKALSKNALDEFDGELLLIGEGVYANRDQMWSSFHSVGAKKNLTACHAARELIDQTLRTLSPDEEIKKQQWFKPNNDSRSGIIRKHRLEYILRDRMPVFSADYLDILHVIMPRELWKEAHLEEINDDEEYINDLLLDTERFLKKLLIYSKKYNH